MATSTSKRNLETTLNLGTYQEENGKATNSIVQIKLPEPTSCILPQTPEEDTVMADNNSNAYEISSSLRALFENNPVNCLAIFRYESAHAAGALRHTKTQINANCGFKDMELGWNDYSCVKLPLSKFCKSKARNTHGTQTWELINTALTEVKSMFTIPQAAKPSKLSKLVKQAVVTYNTAAEEWSFNLLDHPDVKNNLAQLMPFIVDSALLFQERLYKPIPILRLRNQKSKTIYMNQKLACSILANAFFCTFPPSDANLPEINFLSLFDGGPSGQSAIKTEKLKCILHYFKRRQMASKDTLISFEKRCLQENINWSTSEEKLSKVDIHTNGKIEDAVGMLQVDFANRMVGGGILAEGMVQEEIRYSICPELIVSRLFTERLEDNEVLVVTGCERFTCYSGYASSFKFQGDFTDTSKEDPYGRKQTQIVAMDAYHFKSHEKWKQYEKHFVDRELRKCLCGIYPRKHITAIATGNWGCGAFNGDPELKFLIQLLAASQAHGRILNFYTFGNTQQKNRISKFMKTLEDNNTTVARLYKAILKYENECKFTARNSSIFEYIETYLKRKVGWFSGIF